MPSSCETQSRLGRKDRALADYTSAISTGCKTGSTRDAYNARAKLYYETKQFDKAVQDWTKVISALPYCTEPLARRADAYAKMGKPDLAAKDRQHIQAIMSDFGE